LKYAKIGLPVTNQSRRDLRRATHLAAEQPIQSQIVDIVPKGSNPSLTATFSLVSVARGPKTCQLRANFGRDFPVAGIEQSGRRNTWMVVGAIFVDSYSGDGHESAN
jgi:hypothetical protein